MENPPLCAAFHLRSGFLRRLGKFSAVFPALARCPHPTPAFSSLLRSSPANAPAMADEQQQQGPPNPVLKAAG